MNSWKSALGWLRPFSGALKIANAILESFAKVCPPAGGLDELKKILEGSLDIAEGPMAVKKAASRVSGRFRRS